MKRIKMLSNRALKEAFGSTTSLPEVPKVDLRDFLKFMSMCEKVQHTSDQETANIFQNFKDLIYDLNKTVMTGSAVMNFRLGKTTDSEDIDFFIENDPSGKNRATLEAFFISPFYKKVFKEYSKKYLKADNDPQINYKGGTFEKTSYEATYNLIKLDYKIETYRFGFSSIRKYGFNLNFILPKRLIKDERSLLGIQGKLTDSLYKNYFIDEDNDLRFTNKNIFAGGKSSGQDVQKYESKLMRECYPEGLALHIINDSFDFEELKYVYSFELQQTVSTFIAAKMQLTTFKNNIHDLYEQELISDRAMMYTSSNIDDYIINLENRNKKFAELTSEPNTLTIAKSIMPEHSYQRVHYDIEAHLKGASLESIFGDMTTSHTGNTIRHCYSAYHNIMQRVPKYQKRGYEINDPDNFIADLQSYINLHTVYIMQNSNINNIAKRSSLLIGNRESTQKIKLLRESYKVYNTLVNAAGIKIETDPEEGEVPYGEINAL